MTLHGWRLGDPLWLLALLAALLALWVAAWRRRRATLLYSSVALLRGAPITLAQRAKRFLPWLRFAALALVALGLARPQQGLEAFRVRTEGIAIVMALDQSGSMQALDFEIDGRRQNRLEVVKRVFREFVEGNGDLRGRPDDKIGLVAFGGFASDRCPLTLDHGALLAVLDTVKIPEPLLARNGRPVNQALDQEELQTAIGDGLALACERLKEAPDKSKVLILLSDGANDAGVVDPLEAAKAARTLGIKIYTIGIGSNGPVPVPSRDPFGNVHMQSAYVRMDEELLKQVADATGGRYFNASNTQALEHVYAEIDRLEKTKSEGVLYTDYRELYRYALFPALALLFLETLLAATRLRSLP
jgi:Ca-activated chloride channel family protein